MKLGSIQFLRAIAILLIVYAQSIHLSKQTGPSHQQNFYYLSQIGYIGIDLFFVICGFIITYTAHRYSGAREGLQFLQRRFIRINPLFYIASILFFGVQWFQVWATNNPNSFLLNNKMIPGLVDSLWIIPTTDKLSRYKLYLPTGWTLAFVWLFYLVFSITIFANLRKKAIAVTVTICLLVIAGSLFKPTDLRLTFATNIILLEFLLGMLICQLYMKAGMLPKFVPVTFLLAGIAWCMVLVFYNYGHISTPNLILNGTLSLQRFLLWGLPSSFLLAGCVLLEKNKQLQRIWNYKPARLIGNASYSIYLAHSIIFTLLATLYKTNTILLPDVSIFVHLVVVVITGLVVYRYLEKPFIRWLQKVSQHPSIEHSTTQPQSA
ncbi:acyltransferase [Pseudoflavitalea sp. X16]|uniref:acyltransferase family protein n=1 Tax=Paraflavitalea devenefica TaxID=2716334 RepID=UPI00141F8922|nr:acyltransferase [Paraflavitalea devenefica]NII27762.1 acyltransferase [Paraflavitalea devenefica]